MNDILRQRKACSGCLKGTRKMKKINWDRKTIAKLIFLLLFLTVSVLLTIWAFPWVMKLQEPAFREQCKEYIQSVGISGWFIMLAVQVLQVIFAIIPGEPVEVLSGLLFGTWSGLFLCLLGILVGTAIIYCIVKWFGKPFVEMVVSPEKIEKLNFLNNSKRLELIVFILYFIPGTPKDLLTYIVPLTNIKPSAFFLIATLARIPSIVTSTFAGSALYDGNLLTSIIMFAVAGALGICGIIFNQKIMSFFNRHRTGEHKGK